jgi:hypothetical protein|tara:strand:- start:219 stop:455 length:237 start_codon:yes stop_codon:yes gene_type:complete
MKCRLCNRETIENNSGFCPYHNECIKKIDAGFEKWRQAYGELNWQTYLQRLHERHETGDWTKECCYILKKEKKHKFIF